MKCVAYLILGLITTPLPALEPIKPGTFREEIQAAMERKNPYCIPFKRFKESLQRDLPSIPYHWIESCGDGAIRLGQGTAVCKEFNTEGIVMCGESGAISRIPYADFFSELPFILHALPGAFCGYSTVTIPHKEICTMFLSLDEPTQKTRLLQCLWYKHAHLLYRETTKLVCPDAGCEGKVSITTTKKIFSCILSFRCTQEEANPLHVKLPFLDLHTMHKLSAQSNGILSQEILQTFLQDWYKTEEERRLHFSQNILAHEDEQMLESTILNLKLKDAIIKLRNALEELDYADACIGKRALSPLKQRIEGEKKRKTTFPEPTTGIRYAEKISEFDS